MLGLDSRVARYTWTVLVLLLSLAVVYLIAKTLFIFVVALLFSYLLWPLVHFLEQRLPGRSRLPSLAIVYLLLLGVIVVAGVEIGSRIAAQANALATTIPDLLSKLEQPLVSGHGLGAKIIREVQQQLAAHSRELLMPITKGVLSLVSHVEVLLFIVLVPVLSFFFLKDGQNLLASILSVFGEGPGREMANGIANDLHLLLAHYMRALVLLGLAASVAYMSFFSIIGLPYGLLLGAIAFFFEFVPIVGPLTSAVIILLVAGLSGFGHLLWIVFFLAAFRFFQDYVLSPLLLGSGTKLHPLIVIFGVLAGSQIAGIAGAFLSVPALATLRIIYRQLQKKKGAASARLSSL